MKKRKKIRSTRDSTVQKNSPQNILKPDKPEGMGQDTHTQTDKRTNTLNKNII